MAERPVFVPKEIGSQLVSEVSVTFVWHPGMAPSQKMKNVSALHNAAAFLNLSPLLEVSSKSEHEVGRRLSAFSLKLTVGCIEPTIESVFQGSKVFERGGPYTDLYFSTSREAKRDPRLQDSGHLIAFRLEGKTYPLSPSTAFYDWLYLQALFPHREWLKRLHTYAGFTDIEFNPGRSVNCQARSCATFVALDKRGELDRVMSSFEAFQSKLQSAGI